MKIKIKNSLYMPLLSFFLLMTFALDCAPGDKKTISAWIPYWDIKNSTQNIGGNFSGSFQEINPFFYGLDNDGNIINSCRDKNECKQIIDTAAGLGIKIVPAVTNDVAIAGAEKKLKEPEIIHQILSSGDLRKRHIRQIMDVVKETNAQGIDIDYENIDISDKDIFTQFIKELSQALHSENKTLNVTVQHKIEDHQRSGAGAADWQEISPYADKITIMCYNYASKISQPGPICPSFWLKDIIKFAKSQIPPEKICLALPFYGYDWSKEKTNSLNLKAATALINKYKAKLIWDSKSQTPYFIYYQNGIKHTVWFENQKSIMNKIKIIKKYKIQHIAFWHLGILDPSLSDSTKLFLK